jgi:TctA family transporter
MIDENFRRSLMVSSGNPMIFLTHPISLLFLVVIVFTIFRQVRKTKKQKQVTTAGVMMAQEDAMQTNTDDESGNDLDA